MTLIQWRDDFRLGIESVDHEHRELIDLINEAHGRMRDDASHHDVINMLGEIFAKISAHFALEERIMRSAGYPGFLEHKAEHEVLLDEIRDIMDRVDDEGRYDQQRLSAELEQWFTVHFRTQDARLHASIGQGGPAAGASAD